MVVCTKTWSLLFSPLLRCSIRLSLAKSDIFCKFSIGAVNRKKCYFVDNVTLCKMFSQVYAADREMCYLAGQCFDKQTSVFSPSSAVHLAVHWRSSANTAFCWLSSSSGGKWGLYALMEGTSMEELRKWGVVRKIMFISCRVKKSVFLVSLPWIWILRLKTVIQFKHSSPKKTWINVFYHVYTGLIGLFFTIDLRHVVLLCLWVILILMMTGNLS